MLLFLLGRQLIKYKFMRCTKKTLNFLLHWNFTAHARDESAYAYGIAYNVKCRSKNQPSLLFAGCLPLNFTCLSRLEPLPGLLVADSVSVTMDNPDVLPL